MSDYTVQLAIQPFAGCLSQVTVLAMGQRRRACYLDVLSLPSGSGTTTSTTFQVHSPRASARPSQLADVCTTVAGRLS